MRIIGIDPGSRKTGFGIVDWVNNQFKFVACGTLHLKDEHMGLRLKTLHESLLTVTADYQPEVAAIESVFVQDNAQSALKLGQARGVAIAALMLNTVWLHEYAPRLVKQTVVGHGGASKQQVQHMVTALLQLSKAPAQDAADALAIAVCHGIHHNRIGVATPLQSMASGRKKSRHSRRAWSEHDWKSNR